MLCSAIMRLGNEVTPVSCLFQNYFGFREMSDIGFCIHVCVGLTVYNVVLVDVTTDV